MRPRTRRPNRPVRPHRRKRWRRWVVVAVLVLVVGAAVADRVLRQRAEAQIGQQVAAAIGDTATPPRVRVLGTPFLTQVWHGSLDHVTGSAAQATFDGLSATHVSFDARAVGVGDPSTIGWLQVTATVPTATLQDLLRERVGNDGLVLAVADGRLTGTLEVLGQQAVATGTVGVVDGAVHVTVTTVTVGALSLTLDDLPSAVRDQLGRLDVTVQLPHGLALTDAQVVDDGVRVTASGTDVTLDGG